MLGHAPLGAAPLGASGGALPTIGLEAAQALSVPSQTVAGRVLPWGVMHPDMLSGSRQTIMLRGRRSRITLVGQAYSSG
jgi:hypothetical protein